MWGKEERREGKRREERKRYQCLNTSCESCSLDEAVHWRPFNTATVKHMKMGVRKRSRVIFGTVGVIESQGSAVCVTGISSHYVVSCKSLRGVYRRIATLVLTHVLLAVAETHKLTEWTCSKDTSCFSSSCCSGLHAWYCGSSSSMSSYCTQMAKLNSWVEGTQTQGTNHSFSLQGKTYISEKLHEKLWFQKTSAQSFFMLRSMSLTDSSPPLCANDTLHLQHREGHGEG